MTNDILAKLQNLANLKNTGAIDEQEFNRLKQALLEKDKLSPKQLSTRKGIGWQEILAVLFGILGGIIYTLRTKQPKQKKLIVLLVASFCSGVSANLNNPTPKTSSVPTQATNQQNTSVAATVQIGKFSFSNATVEPYEYYGDADVGGRLVKVSFDVKNIGNKSESAGTFFALKDAQGREFEEAAFEIQFEEYQEGGKQKGDYILPGSTNRLSLVFDVSQDAEKFQLGIGSLLSGKQWIDVQ